MIRFLIGVLIAVVFVAIWILKLLHDPVPGYLEAAFAVILVLRLLLGAFVGLMRNWPSRILAPGVSGANTPTGPGNPGTSEANGATEAPGVS